MQDAAGGELGSALLCPQEMLPKLGFLPQIRFPPQIMCHIQALSLPGVFLCHVRGAWVKWVFYVPKIYEKLLSFDSIKNAVGNTAHFLDVSKYWL